MIALPTTLAVPLWTDEDGKIRVEGTRVLLETVITAFHQGETPEGIVECYSTLSLSAVYGVVTYYLTHRAEVDDYMQRVAAAGEQTQRESEAVMTPEVKALRARLREKLAAGERRNP